MTIALDDASTHFKVPKFILRDASEYFTSALDGKFSEAAKKRIRLRYCETQTAEVLIYWLYQKELPDFESELGMKCAVRTLGGHQFRDPPPEEETTQHYILLARLWMLGDYLMMPKLQNAAMTKLLNISRMHPSMMMAATTIAEVFRISYSGSVLRRVVLEQATWQSYRGADTMGDEELATLMAIPEFAQGFVSRLREIHGDKDIDPMYTDNDDYMVEVKEWRVRGQAVQGEDG